MRTNPICYLLKVTNKFFLKSKDPKFLRAWEMAGVLLAPREIRMLDTIVEIMILLRREGKCLNMKCLLGKPRSRDFSQEKLILRVINFKQIIRMEMYFLEKEFEKNEIQIKYARRKRSPVRRTFAPLANLQAVGRVMRTDLVEIYDEPDFRIGCLKRDPEARTKKILNLFQLARPKIIFTSATNFINGPQELETTWQLMSIPFSHKKFYNPVSLIVQAAVRVLEIGYPTIIPEFNNILDKLPKCSACGNFKTHFVPRCPEGCHGCKDRFCMATLGNRYDERDISRILKRVQGCRSCFFEALKLFPGDLERIEFYLEQRVRQNPSEIRRRKITSSEQNGFRLNLQNYLKRHPGITYSS